MVHFPDPLPPFAPGWVWLVGAGPGDPALLTLGACQALQQADVVLHDGLIGEGVLAHAQAAAVCEPVGKRAGRPSPKQAEISARLIALARTGKRVLRLKGGDPFLFGRGPEEARDLVRAGVPFRVIPGVPAAPGGLAYAGIPVTSGEGVDAVTFVTATAPDAELPDLDWAALARGAPVLVIFMGLRRMEEIAEHLQAGGRPPAEPVAVVAKASQPGQQVLETTLADAADAIARHDPPSPALIAVGPTVRLRPCLDWLGALAGRTLVADPPC